MKKPSWLATEYVAVAKLRSNCSVRDAIVGIRGAKETHKAPYWTVSRAWAQATRLASTRERDCIVSAKESGGRGEKEVVFVFLSSFFLLFRLLLQLHGGEIQRLAAYYMSFYLGSHSTCDGSTRKAHLGVGRILSRS